MLVPVSVLAPIPVIVPSRPVAKLSKNLSLPTDPLNVVLDLAIH